MSKVLIGLCVSLASLFVVALLASMVYFSYSNSEIKLRNAANAQQQANEAIFDNVWKTIQQQAEVSSEYKNAFAEIWKDIISSRYQNARGGALMSFIKEHNPDFSPDLYKKLMNTIESERKEFLNNQKKLIDLKREHDNMRTTFPGSLICGNRSELEITIVTSSKTQDVFENKKEENIEIFPKKDKK